MAWRPSRSPPGPLTLKPCSESNVGGPGAELHRSIRHRRYVRGKRETSTSGLQRHRMMKTGRPPRGKKTARIGCGYGTQGAENVTSKRPYINAGHSAASAAQGMVLAVYLNVAPSWAESVTMLVLIVCSLFILRGLPVTFAPRARRHPMLQ